MHATSDADRIDGYAAALLSVTRAEGDPEGLSDELFRVASEMGKSQDLLDALRRTDVPFERRRNILRDLLGGKVHDVTLSLVEMLVAVGRLGDLAAITSRMSELAAEQQALVVAEITTAVPLDDATLAKLVATLERATGKNLFPQVTVDSSVIGGVVARVGDTVYDGSVRSRFQDLREAWG